jgi:5-methylcytosine-specific restriction endonuclease McrA
MHKLKRVTGKPSDYLNRVVQGKTGDRQVRLKNYLNKVSKRYAKLEKNYSIQNIGDMAVEQWAPQTREDLLHCYDNATLALVQLKDRITECQTEGTRDICPYCGIGQPGQFDHYLPKEKFPEFSVHAYNLVPCCSVCNGKKSDAWLNSKRDRIFLDFYIDSLPTAPMLELDIQWVIKKGKLVPIVEFKLVGPKGFGKAAFSLIETHFTKLDLLSRYRELAHSEYTALRVAALAREAKTIRVLRSFLANFLNGWEKTLGSLNWKICLYRAIADEERFLHDCLKS